LPADARSLFDHARANLDPGGSVRREAATDPDGAHRRVMNLAADLPKHFVLSAGGRLWQIVL
jgi:hypothetical protein